MVALEVYRVLEVQGELTVVRDSVGWAGMGVRVVRMGTVEVSSFKVDLRVALVAMGVRLDTAVSDRVPLSGFWMFGSFGFRGCAGWGWGSG